MPHWFRHFWGNRPIGHLALRCLLASAVVLPVSLAVSAPEARATAICPTGFSAVNSPVTICQRTLTVTGTWTVPAGVTSIDYVLVGGGGGGGGSSPGFSGTIHGGGGGGGAVAVKNNYAVTSGANLYATIGRGGAGPIGYSPGSEGEASYFPGSGAPGGGGGGSGVSPSGGTGGASGGGSGGAGGAGTTVASGLFNVSPVSVGGGGGGGSASSDWRGAGGAGGAGGGGAGGNGCSSGGAGGFGGGGGGGGACASDSWFGGKGGGGAVILRTAAIVPVTAPAAPSISAITASSGQLSIAFTPGATGGSVITNYQYSTNGGSSWVTRSPVSTASPLVVSGLANGTTYNVQLRAVNDVGSGTATSSSSATPLAPGLTPLFDAPVSTTDGFTVSVTNVDPAYTWTPSVTAGTLVVGTVSGALLPLTVTGLSAGASATITVAVTRSGYATSTGTATGRALRAQTVTWAPTTSITTIQTPHTPSTIASALGGAAITYSRKLGFTTSTCSVHSATGVVTHSGVGSCTVVATSSATSAYAAGSREVTFTISRAVPDITWNPVTGFTVLEESTLIAAASSSGGGAMTYSLGTNSAGCVLSGRSLTFTSAGSCEVLATSAATDFYAAAATKRTFVVSRASQNVVWAPPSALSLSASESEFSDATASGGAAITYSVVDAGTTGCSFPSPSSPTLNYSTAGTCTVMATAAETSAYGQASRSISIAINMAVPMMTWSPARELSMPGRMVTPAAASTNGDGAMSFGVSSDSASLCSVDPVSGAVTYWRSGDCAVTASSATSLRFSGVTKTVVFTISRAPQSISAFTTSHRVEIGQTATVTSSGSVGAGAITWSQTGDAGICIMDGSTVTAVAEGSCELMVSIASDDAYTASTATVIITVIRPRVGDGGGGGGAASAGDGGESSTPSAASTMSQGDRPVAVMNQETPLTELDFPGASSPTRGKSLPPPPERVQVMPMTGRLRSSVAVRQPSGDGSSNILATVIVVRDGEGKVITRITVEAVPGRSQSRVTIPLIAPGYSVSVYNVNEVGVSLGALAKSPLVHATTISARGRNSAPALFGKRIGRTIIFDGGSSALDRGDKRALAGIARSIARSTDRIFITGFARKGGGSETELATLSTDRARAVATYLAERGVRVWMRFWGAGSLDGVGHPRERRVEIHASALAIPRNLVL